MDNGTFDGEDEGDGDNDDNDDGDDDNDDIALLPCLFVLNLNSGLEKLSLEFSFVVIGNTMDGISSSFDMSYLFFFLMIIFEAIANSQ